MNNTVNKQQKVTQKQYRQLTLNSPLFKYLQPAGYNLIDEDEGVTHIHKMGFGESLNFIDIKHDIYHATNIVSYWIEPNGAIRFNIHDTVTDSSRNIIIYESSQREAVEQIFQIKLSPDKATLASLDDDNFESSIDYFFNPDAFDSSYVDVYLETVTNGSCEVYAKTFDDYKAGVAHMKYLIGSLPEITWCTTKDEVVEGVYYKFLSYGHEEDRLYLSFKKANRKGKSKSFSFCLDFSMMDEDEEVQYHKSYENEELFQKLKPMYRKQSLDSILKSL